MSRASVEFQGDAQDLLLLDEDTLDRTKHYRFVQSRSQNVARKMAQGYEIVLRSEHGVKLLTDGLQSDAGGAEDQVRNGDTILMMCDKSRHIERRRRTSRLSAARLDASEQQFKEQAQRRGVRPLIGDEGE